LFAKKALITSELLYPLLLLVVVDKPVNLKKAAQVQRLAEKMTH
jgi:hypothetical protein